ncbi:FolC bifunctional protein [Venturia nashicola]|uniref:Folylpolyglutamate synthase n=1 Tax=Venturia nashicola TaxID=86259 RepID=A0A4Z1PU96_9PEZI|nr:FolC bifunctional protein [Venturia nashicola]
MEPRDYKAAITALNTLQTNFSILGAIKKSGRSMNGQAIPQMIDFAKRIGYQPSDFKKFHSIHIAGTKGKGSTSAFISSILYQYTQDSSSSSPKKVGLYTSPHLCSVRERIQINNEPISESDFSKYFFEVWDRLSTTGDGSKPVYFRYLTLMAYHLFVVEGVDSAVIECGIGGEYDSTNIITEPTVTAVTALGIDHVGVLGNTIEEIAWHKAGVFKKGALALSVPQPESALEVLKKRAGEAGTELHVVQRIPSIANGEVRLGLAGDFQKSNASIAVATAATHLRTIGLTDLPDPTNITTLPAKFIKGLAEVKWPGRCDIRKERSISWCLDGAHTLESIQVAGEWFAEVSQQSKAPHILIFNQQTRDAPTLAQKLFATLSTSLSSTTPFTHAIFTTNVTFKTAGYKPDLVSNNTNTSDIKTLKVQNELAKVWTNLDPAANVVVTGTIEEALDTARNVLGERQGLVLVTGSLHLVGGAIELLQNGGVE